MTTWTWGYLAQQFIMLFLWLLLLWAVYGEIRKWNADESEVFTLKKRRRKTGRISRQFFEKFPLEARPSALQEEKFPRPRRFPS
jgi:hypothetical protein